MTEQKITKKRIEELQAESDRLKAESDIAVQRWNDAQARVWAAEREFKRNEKPTPAMLEVLRHLANDNAGIFKNLYRSGYSLRIPGERSTTLRDSIFYGLRDREAISVQNSDERRAEWDINDHGRELLERYAKKVKASNPEGTAEKISK